MWSSVFTHWCQPRTLVHGEISILVFLISRCSWVRWSGLFPASAEDTWKRRVIQYSTEIRWWGGGLAGQGGRSTKQRLNRQWLTFPGRASAASGAGSGTSAHCGPASCPQARRQQKNQPDSWPFLYNKRMSLYCTCLSWTTVYRAAAS